MKKRVPRLNFTKDNNEENIKGHFKRKTKLTTTKH